MYKVRFHNSTTTPTMDVDLTDEALNRLTEGLWLTRQGEISQGEHSVVYPAYMEGVRSDAQALGKSAVVTGWHIAETDMIVQTEDYTVGQDLTVASGTENKGLLTPASSGDPVVADVSQTKDQLGSERAIEIEVPA